MREEIIEYCGVDIAAEHMFIDEVFDRALLGICFRTGEYFSPAYDLDMVLNMIREKENISEAESIETFNKLVEDYPEISFIKYDNGGMDELAKYNNDMLFLDGYDPKALVGVRIKSGSSIIAIYDDTLCLESLMDNDDMTEEDAIDYFEYNTRGSYVGENTPAFLTLL